MIEAIDYCRYEDSIGVVIFTGTGDKAFCSELATVPRLKYLYFINLIFFVLNLLEIEIALFLTLSPYLKDV